METGSKNRDLGDFWRSASRALLGAAVLVLVGCAATTPGPSTRAPAAPVVTPLAAGTEPLVLAPAQPRAARADGRADAVPRTASKAAEAQARPASPPPATAPADTMADAVVAPPAEARAEEARSPMPDDGAPEVGIASWYGGFFHGRRTALGERFDMHRMTAAHKTMPLPSFALVRHQGSGKEVVVRVNDRGPFIAGRIIDLSRAAARELGIDGIGRVEVHRLAHNDDRVRAWHAQSRAQARLQAPATRPRAAARPRATAGR